jgi:hypothetical protein
MGTSKRSKINLNEYFEIGHLYQYKFNKLSQIKANGGKILTKTYILKSFTKEWDFGVLTKAMIMEDIEGDQEETIFPYKADSAEILKKIS